MCMSLNIRNIVDILKRFTDQIKFSYTGKKPPKRYNNTHLDSIKYVKTQELYVGWVCTMYEHRRLIVFVFVCLIFYIHAILF